MPTKKFKKLSNDGMSKLVFSNKRIMSIFLKRVLNKPLDQDIKIINKRGQEWLSKHEDEYQYDPSGLAEKLFRPCFSRNYPMGGHNYLF